MSFARLRSLTLPPRFTFCCFALIIRANDARDQRMSYNVTLFEADDADALDAFDGVQGVP